MYKNKNLACTSGTSVEFGTGNLKDFDCDFLWSAIAVTTQESFLCWACTWLLTTSSPAFSTTIKFVKRYQRYQNCAKCHLNVNREPFIASSPSFITFSLR